MAEYYTIITDAGRALEAAALAGGPAFNLQMLALGDGSEKPAPDATALQNEVWRGAISMLAPDDDNPTWLIAETRLPPDVGGFMVREFGIYTDTGVLFAVGNYPETYKPTLAEGTGVDLVLRPILEVSNAAAITLLVDPSVVMASKKYVDDAIASVDVSGQLAGLVTEEWAEEKFSSLPFATNEEAGLSRYATAEESSEGARDDLAVTPVGLAASIVDKLDKSAAIMPVAWCSCSPSGGVFRSFGIKSVTRTQAGAYVVKLAQDRPSAVMAATINGNDHWAYPFQFSANQIDVICRNGNRAISDQNWGLVVF